MKNVIVSCDSYKASHFQLYPAETKFYSSYIESRGGEYEKTLFFGLQGFIKQYLLTPITKEQIEKAKVFWTAHGLPFNEEGWNHILNKHGGYLPLRICAPKEGLLIDTHNVLVQVENTDPEVPWLTSYIETILLRGIWYPTTVATRSHHIKQIIKKYMNKTSDTPEAISFKLHDFGQRGVSSGESAAIGGCAHLVNFMGTDTTEALEYAFENYNEPMAGFSIPALEHSITTAWGATGMAGELECFDNAIDKYAKAGTLLALVADTYDVYAATEYTIGGALKEKIENSGATIVVRPDSGDPTVVPVHIVEILAERFGYTVNNKGYKVLPNCVRVIQGDGVNEHSIEAILHKLEELGFSADNIAFGMGGALLQGLNRDTLKFAMKGSAIQFEEDEWIGIQKKPITDPGKASKKGRLALIKEANGGYKTVSEEGLDPRANKLEVVFENGKLIREQSFAEIRELSNQ